MLARLLKDLTSKKEMTIKVRVHAGAKQSMVKNLLADKTLKVDIAVSPEQGQANLALIKLLADESGLDKKCFKIITGQFTKDKLIKITI